MTGGDPSVVRGGGRGELRELRFHLPRFLLLFFFERRLRSSVFVRRAHLVSLAAERRVQERRERSVRQGDAQPVVPRARLAKPSGRPEGQEEPTPRARRRFAVAPPRGRDPAERRRGARRGGDAVRLRVPPFVPLGSAARGHVGRVVRLRESLVGPVRQVEARVRVVRARGRLYVRGNVRGDGFRYLVRRPRAPRAPRLVAPQLRAQLLQGLRPRVRPLQARLGEGRAPERRARGVERLQEQVRPLVAASVGAAGFDSADVRLEQRARPGARRLRPGREVRAAPRGVQLLRARQARLPRRVRRAVLGLGERDVPPPPQVEEGGPSHADVVPPEQQRRADVGEIVAPGRVFPGERARRGGAHGGHFRPERLLEDRHRAPREGRAVPVATGDRRADAARRGVERRARQRVAASGGERRRRRQRDDGEREQLLGGVHGVGVLCLVAEPLVRHREARRDGDHAVVARRARLVQPPEIAHPRNHAVAPGPEVGDEVGVAQARRAEASRLLRFREG